MLRTFLLALMTLALAQLTARGSLERRWQEFDVRSDRWNQILKLARLPKRDIAATLD